MEHSLQPLTPVYTAALFAPLHEKLLGLLSGLSPEEWQRPTVAGSWGVRDVVAHLIDGQMRRLSFQRDGAPLPEPSSPVDDYRSLVVHLNELNAEWVRAMHRVSEPQLLGMLERVGREFAEFVAGLDPLAAGFFPVAWAGEEQSRNWMDLGRDYTELWHHQAQIRDAVGAELLNGKEWLHPVLDLAIRGVRRGFADFDSPAGAALVVQVEGEAGGHWSIVREPGAWVIYRGSHPEPTGLIRMSADSAWRLLFNALDVPAAASAVFSSGDRRLVRRFLRVRGVMV